MEQKKLMIIAAPKTASTSLLYDLSKITGLRGEQLFLPEQKVSLNFINKGILRSQRYINKLLGGGSLTASHQPRLRDLYPSTEYPFLRVLHSDVCDLRNVSSDQFNQLFPFVIHKQHLPPTEPNIDLVRNFCDIILLINEPEEIMDSYSRVPEIKQRYHFTEKKFQDGLLNDLRKFVELWKKVVPSNQTIYKEELIKTPYKAINSCLSLMNMEHKFVGEDYQLSKKRYYRRD